MGLDSSPMDIPYKLALVVKKVVPANMITSQLLYTPTLLLVAEGQSWSVLA